MRYRSRMITKGTKLLPYPGEAVLRNLYEQRRYSVRATARVLDAQPSTVRRWLRELGVQMRSISEAKTGQKPAAHTVEASVRARRKRVLEGKPAVGYKLRSDGYVDIWLPAHPFASRSGYIKEHRLVMEKVLGRYLLPTEDVHHKNGQRGDNRPENLELLPSRADHMRHHYPERVLDSRTGRFLPGQRIDL